VWSVTGVQEGSGCRREVVQEVSAAGGKGLIMGLIRGLMKGLFKGLIKGLMRGPYKGPVWAL